MARRGSVVAILGVLAAFGAACAGTPARPPTWAARRAEAQIQRALEAEARQDPGAARELAGQALTEARGAADPSATARAKALIGRLDGDHLLLLDAIDLLEALGEDEALVATRLDLAELALSAGRHDLASAEVEAARSRLEQAGLDRVPEARLSARLWHVGAGAARQAGARQAALASERQANLMLSLLADEDSQPLRVAVAQSLGDDFAADGDPRQAFVQHSRASSLARQLDDRAGELAAINSLSLDLAAMGRASDALSHCDRALDIALELGDEPRAAELARRALQLLMALGETPGSERWLHFSLVLKRS